MRTPAAAMMAIDARIRIRACRDMKSLHCRMHDARKYTCELLDLAYFWKYIRKGCSCAPRSGRFGHARDANTRCLCMIDPISMRSIQATLAIPQSDFLGPIAPELPPLAPYWPLS